MHSVKTYLHTLIIRRAIRTAKKLFIAEQYSECAKLQSKYSKYSWAALRVYTAKLGKITNYSGKVRYFLAINDARNAACWRQYVIEEVF